METRDGIQRGEIGIVCPGLNLAGTLSVPRSAIGVVLFAHGSGSSRRSARNIAVARTLEDAGLATLLLDLLTTAEDEREQAGAMLRFDVQRLAERLGAAIEWLAREPATRDLPLGIFGASTGAAVALIAAAASPSQVLAVVSRGGRADLAGHALAGVSCPTRLIVGGADEVVLELNREALRQLTCVKDLIVVPGATHLFEEPGALNAVAHLAAEWFATHLRPARVRGGHGALDPRSQVDSRRRSGPRSPAGPRGAGQPEPGEIDPPAHEPPVPRPTEAPPRVEPPTIPAPPPPSPAPSLPEVGPFRGFG